MDANRRWTKEEEILALYAYCNVPFNKASNSHPFIVKTAQLISRSPASVKMKIGNFGSFDPRLQALGIVGLTGVSKLDEQVWQTYYGNWDKLAIDAAKITADLSNRSIEDIVREFPAGLTKTVSVKQRINQNFFRNVVLNSYNNTCCISGISETSRLEACHIVSWTENEAIRTDPTNGLCMNPLFHKAYDKFLISVTADFDIRISDSFLSQIGDMKFRDYMQSKDNSKITMPHKFTPNRDFLDQHHQKYIQIHA
jgi:putative restriction endonuclease